MNEFPQALGLSAEQTELALRLAGMAPSLHNSQPWRFRLSSEIVELHADQHRRLPVADPTDRELRLACGAALFNFRLALAHFRLRSSVQLGHHRQPTDLLATVRSAGAVTPDAEQVKLFRVIRSRRTNRRPFLPAPVPDSHWRRLSRAVAAEHGWLRAMDHDQRIVLQALMRQAHETQMADHCYRAELAKWTGHQRRRRDGVRPSPAGSLREEQAEWVLRNPRCSRRVPGKAAADPLMVVLCSEGSGRANELRAGQALQRMLLTATALGLTVSFMSQVVELEETRSALKEVLGEAEPVAMLRVGYGSPVPATPRRRPRELLLEEPSVASSR